MPDAQPIYTHTREAKWPLLDAYVTVTARHAEDDDVVAITWQRDDLAAKDEPPLTLILTVDEVRGIAAAVDERTS